jgi:hypothetical protein
MNPPFPLTLTDRFALIISALHAAVAARIKCPPVTAEIIVFVCARLKRIAREFERLAARIRAGTYVARSPVTRRAGGAGSRRGASIVMLHYNLGLPPWAPGWLHRIAPGDAGGAACALRNLLSDPEMAAVIAAVPRMRRILNPLCFMLKMEAGLLRPAPPPPPAPDTVGAGEDQSPVVTIADVAAPRDPVLPDSVARCDTGPPGALIFDVA